MKIPTFDIKYHLRNPPFPLRPAGTGRGDFSGGARIPR